MTVMAVIASCSGSWLTTQASAGDDSGPCITSETTFVSRMIT